MKLAQKALELWTEEVRSVFGLPILDHKSTVVSQEYLDRCSEIWSEGDYLNPTSLLQEVIFDKMDSPESISSFQFIYDERSELLRLIAIVSETYETGEFVTYERPIMSLPLFYDDFTYSINDTKYVPRVRAIRVYSQLCRYVDKEPGANEWRFDVGNFSYRKQVGKEPEVVYKWRQPVGVESPTKDDFIGSITTRDRLMYSELTGVPGLPTPEYIFDNIQKLPAIDFDSIKWFSFDRMEHFVRQLAESGGELKISRRHRATLNIVKLMLATDDEEGSRVVSKTYMYNLESYMTCIFKPEEGKYPHAFNFSEFGNFFDPYKTSTSNMAGRSRLLLDDVYLEDGIMFRDIVDPNTGEFLEKINMFRVEGQYRCDEVSSLSESKFSMNDAPKRIMMNAKMKTQGMQFEDGSFDIDARVMFADFEGFGSGDSFVVSESFAKRLKAYKHKIVQTNKDMKRFLKVTGIGLGDSVDLDREVFLPYGNDMDRVEDLRIVRLYNRRIELGGFAPAGVGDKIANLHGTKGTIGMILPDDQMPRLINDLGPAMPAGTIDVILPAVSVFKRKAYGQIFEAWATATGQRDVGSAAEAAEKFLDEIKEYSELSVVEFNGPNGPVKFKAITGLNNMMRLDHDATGKRSYSIDGGDPKSMLRFGEMELLNLLSRGKIELLRDITSRVPDVFDLDSSMRAIMVSLKKEF